MAKYLKTLLILGNIVAIKAGILSLLLSFSLWAKTSSYRAGDVILISLPCYICSLIELEENSLFSHVGVINIENNQAYVYEAWGKVKKSLLSDFLVRTKKKSLVRILRHKDANKIYQSEASYYFAQFYEGLRYDSLFRWDNKDSKGNEKLYCSEFVYKFLSHFINLKLKPKKMHFNRHRKTWESFFKNNVPDNLPGLAPEDFNRTDEFFILDEFYFHD